MRTGCVFSEKLSRGKLHGEDAYPYAKGTIVAVADGLGGRGPEQYKDSLSGEIYSSAYIGANTVMEAMKAIPDKLITGEIIKGAVLECLANAKKRYEKINTGVSSSMFKVFPTTLAVGRIDGDILHAYWCGDSRIYVLSSTKGLIQISKDDLADEKLDPFKNIVEQGQMSQYVSLSSNFSINEANYQFSQENALVFAASDGVFDYFESPMHFELFLLKELQAATDFDEFISNMQKRLIEISGDDVSMGMIFRGSDSYTNWKIGIKSRYGVLSSELYRIEEKKKKWEENAELLDNIHEEMNALYEMVLSKEMPLSIKKYLKSELPKEQEEFLKRNLPEWLIEEVENYKNSKCDMRDILKTMEKSALVEITKDYLGREQRHIRIWTNEYKYRELLAERDKIQEVFAEIVSRLTEIESLLVDYSDYIKGELLRENPISEVVISDVKKVCEDFMTIARQGSLNSRISKRKDRCENCITKLCNSVSEKNEDVFREYLYGKHDAPFFLNEKAKLLIDTFQKKVEEVNLLQTKEAELEEEVKRYFSNIRSYDDISLFVGEADMKKIKKLIEKELLHKKEKAAFEKEVQVLLEELWKNYKISYELYEMCV